MKKLWEKGTQLNAIVEAFETKEDLLLDQKLVMYDVYGTLAHVSMLKEIGTVTSAEFVQAKKGLTEVLSLYNAGKFQLELGDEDVHTKIEVFLTEKYGDVGKKMHTGRSRNDQSLTMLRLFGKDHLATLMEAVLSLTKAFFVFAMQHEDIPMPGYTHMQKAMPMSIGMWASAFVESLLDDMQQIMKAYDLFDQSPLGSGAGFGLPFDTKRALTAKYLGFAKVQNNPLYCQNARGKSEAVVVAAYTNVLLTINKFASDVLLFTTSEFDYFTVSESLCTGSSIMPQKKNVDLAELLRSKVHLVSGYYTALVGICSDLISGYNRDLQDTKKPFVEATFITIETAQVAKVLVENIAPNMQELQKALTPDLYATHYALSLVKQGIPFRDAYKKAASLKFDANSFETKTYWQLDKKGLAKRIDQLTNEIAVKRETLDHVLKKLLMKSSSDRALEDGVAFVKTSATEGGEEV